jgi:hypothetical protein
MANGNCWFVEEVVQVDSANAEIKLLGELDLKRQAVVDSRFKDLLPESLIPDSNAVIEMVEYHPDRITYHSSSSTEQVAIFSEMHYPEGWNAWIDGEEVEYFRANYALRGLWVPAGEHDIEFVFEPSSYSTGSVLSIIGSILVFLFVGSLAYLDSRKKIEVQSS